MSGAMPAVRALLDELARSGVEHVALCPGKRCLPLIVAAVEHPILTTSSHIDERAGAFFALGLARATMRPTAIVTTSGTAGAHAYAAVIEARYARVPLIVITADRPARLQNCGAPQTVDQRALFGRHTLLDVEIALPLEPLATAEWQAMRAQACHAVAVATGRPCGPVHLNVPLDEPLVPSSSNTVTPKGTASEAPWVQAPGRGLLEPGAGAVHAVVQRVNQEPRGAIVLGAHEPDAELATVLQTLAARAGYPLLVDPLSPLRFGQSVDAGVAAVLGGHDLVARALAARHGDASLRPLLSIRIGAPPTSKHLLQVLEGGERVVVDGDGEDRDPNRDRGALIRADSLPFVEALLAVLDETSISGERPFAQAWREADARARAHVDATCEGRWFEGVVAREVVLALAAGDTLFVGSSTPIRDVDWFCPPAPKGVRVLGCRGANGIDGSISQALGASLAANASGGRLTALIGDVAALHDLGGLLACRRVPGVRATIVIVNNDGGGIFSLLPGVDGVPGFDEYVATRHGVTFEAAASMMAAGYSRVEDAASLAAALEAARANGAVPVTVIEAVVPPVANAADLAACLDASRLLG